MGIGFTLSQQCQMFDIVARNISEGGIEGEIGVGRTLSDKLPPRMGEGAMKLYPEIDLRPLTSSSSPLSDLQVSECKRSASENPPQSSVETVNYAAMDFAVMETLSKVKEEREEERTEKEGKKEGREISKPRE